MKRNEEGLRLITMTSAEAVVAMTDGLQIDDQGSTPARRPTSDDLTLGVPASASGWIGGASISLMVPPEDDDAVIERFTSGNCAAFAYALWLMRGRDPSMGMTVLVDENEEPHSDDHPYCHTHVYAETPDENYDVRGSRSLTDMADDFTLISWTTIGPYEPDQFRREFTGRGDEPLYCDDDEIARAIAYIRRNPARYGIPHPGDQA